MNEQQYLGLLVNIAGAIDALAQADTEWVNADTQLDAWDQLDRMRGDLGVIIRQHAVELAKKVPGEYLHPRAGLVHTETEKTTEYDGDGVLRALTEHIVDAKTGEVVDCIPIDVLQDVLPAVKPGAISSKWNTTGLRRWGIHVENYRRTKWGDKVLKRGPRYSRPARPPKGDTDTLEPVSTLPAGTVPSDQVPGGTTAGGAGQAEPESGVRQHDSGAS